LATLVETHTLQQLSISVSWKILLVTTTHHSNLKLSSSFFSRPLDNRRGSWCRHVGTKYAG